MPVATFLDSVPSGASSFITALSDDGCTADTFDAESPSTPVADSDNWDLADGSGTGMSFSQAPGSPATPTLSASGSGGSLAAGTYTYRVVAVNSAGHSHASGEAAPVT